MTRPFLCHFAVLLFFIIFVFGDDCKNLVPGLQQAVQDLRANLNNAMQSEQQFATFKSSLASLKQQISTLQTQYNSQVNQIQTQFATQSAAMTR